MSLFATFHTTFILMVMYCTHNTLLRSYDSEQTQNILVVPAFFNMPNSETSLEMNAKRAN